MLPKGRCEDKKAPLSNGGRWRAVALSCVADRLSHIVGALLRVDRGKVTAEIMQGLWGEIVVVMGGCRHSSDATAVGKRKQK